MFEVKGRFSSGPSKTIIAYAEYDMQQHEMKVVDSQDNSIYIIFTKDKQVFSIKEYKVRTSTLQITDASNYHMRVDSEDDFALWIEIRLDY
jgi:hypothetical protein